MLKKSLFMGVLALAFAAAPARAALIDVIDYCPSVECTDDGLAAATLTINSVDGGDPNDYTFTLLFTGAATGAPASIDQVEFHVESAVQADYDGLPSLTAFPGGSGPWQAAFANVPNCPAGPGGPNSVCAGITGVGAVPATLGDGNSASWEFLVNFDDAFGVLEAGDGIVMRASFDQGQFSPGTRLITTENPVTTETPVTFEAPEPASLGLLGLALLGVAYRVRRRA